MHSTTNLHVCAVKDYELNLEDRIIRDLVFLLHYYNVSNLTDDVYEAGELQYKIGAFFQNKNHKELRAPVALIRSA